MLSGHIYGFCTGTPLGLMCHLRLCSGISSRTKAASRGIGSAIRQNRNSLPTVSQCARCGWAREAKMNGELTDFQKAILWAVEQGTNQMASTWEIAQVAFPDKWKKRSGRGALIGHIDRAGQKMSDILARLPPRDEHGEAIFCKRRW